jgi:hypothetical protein
MSLETDTDFWASLLTRNNDLDSDSDLEDEPSHPPVDQLHSQPDSTSTGHADPADTPTEATIVLVKDALTYLASKGLTLAKFLHCISWGDSACVADNQIRAARTALMNSTELPLILHNWWKPPQSTASCKSRSKAAHPAMEVFTSKCHSETLEHELEAVSVLFKTSDDVSEEFFTGTFFEHLVAEIQELAPSLWSVMQQLMYTKKQVQRNTSKNPNKVKSVVFFGYDMTANLEVGHSNDRLNALLYTVPSCQSLAEVICSVSQVLWTFGKSL